MLSVETEPDLTDTVRPVSVIFRPKRLGFPAGYSRDLIYYPHQYATSIN